MTDNSEKDTNNEDRFKNFSIIENRIKEDISNIKSIWTGLLGVIFSLLISILTIGFTNVIKIDNPELLIFSLFILIGFLFLLLVYTFYLQKELSTILLHLSIVFFKTEIDVPEMIIFYYNLKTNFSTASQLKGSSKSAYILLSKLEKKLVKIRFWAVLVIGLVFPLTMVVGSVEINPTYNVGVLVILIILSIIAYSWALLTLYVSSNERIANVERIIKASFIDVYSDLDKFWIYNLMKNFQKIDFFNKTGQALRDIDLDENDEAG